MPHHEAELFYSSRVTDCIKESVEDDLLLRHRRRIHLFDSASRIINDHFTNCNGIIWCSVTDARTGFMFIVSLHVPRQALEVTSLDWFCVLLIEALRYGVETFSCCGICNLELWNLRKVLIVIMLILE